MNTIFVVLKRQWFSHRRNLVSWIFFFVFLPILLYMVFGLSLYKIIPNVDRLNYLHWAAPGIWVTCGFLMSYLTAFNSMHQLRRSRGLLTIYLKAPISCWSWSTGQIIWSILIGSVQLIIALILIGFINKELFSILKWFSILTLTFPAVIFGAVFGSIMGFWFTRPSSSVLINILVVIGFLSCSGSFIPLTYFPVSLQSAFMVIPIVREILALQHLILNSEVWVSGAILTCVLSAVIFVINGAMIQYWIRK
ncbi:MAG: ABC transporter permease [Fidelibacterota bacterium]